MGNFHDWNVVKYFTDGKLMLLFSCTQTHQFESLKGSVFMVVLWPALAAMWQFGIFLTATFALPIAQVGGEVQTELPFNVVKTPESILMERR